MSSKSGEDTLPLTNLDGRFTLNLPTKFGEKFTVIKPLGRGAFGSVYLVKDDTNKKYVLKVSHSKNAECLAMEHHIGRLILHPCFVPALELFEEGDFTCLLFEYIPGQTLSEFMKNSQTIIIKKMIIEQLGLAIEHLHNMCGFAHLDLKPDNILIVMVKNVPIVKIIDLGLACSINTLNKLASGQRGTPIYMAPEIARGEEYTESADIWSLGKIIAWILTGKDGSISGNMFVQIIHTCNVFSPPIPDQMKSDPEMLWGLSLCEACLQIIPDQRSSALQLLKMISSIKID